MPDSTDLASSGSTLLSPPQTPERSQTERDIIGAAASVFAEKGIAATRVEDLLEAAGVSRRTFYKYFGSKIDALSALYDLATEMLVSAINAAVQNSEPGVARARAAIGAYLEYHSAAPALLRVLQPEAMRGDSPLFDKRRAVQRQLIALFDREVRTTQGRAVDAWVFRGLLLSLEGLSMHLLESTDCAPEDLSRANAVMAALVENVLALPGDDATALPLAERQG
ncbi:MAG: TetR/AcrR family transcriptional regulator [Myxococcales bacterium]|nr:TetR/AcrR family transcriptional regulator [Myxococcales bacterium]